MQRSAIIIILGSLTNYAVYAEIHRLNCTLNFKSWYMLVNGQWLSGKDVCLWLVDFS